jgi:hypothetical protein
MPHVGRKSPFAPFGKGGWGDFGQDRKRLQADVLVSKHMLCREPGYNPLQ